MHLDLSGLPQRLVPPRTAMPGGRDEGRKASIGLTAGG